MDSGSLFFSLRWKLAILFGILFVIFQCAFAFISYQHAQANFENGRQAVKSNHLNVARTLTKESALVLEQFAELVSLVNEQPVTADKNSRHAISSLNDNWARWQLIWDIENIAFFDRQGVRVQSWGKDMVNSDATVQRVLRTEYPEHLIFCPANCYQQAVIPVMGEGQVAGVFSVIRSFADVIIKYNEATDSDLGILVTDSAPKNDPIKDHQWQYKLSGITSPEKNSRIYEFISKNYHVEDFLDASKRIEYDRATYEVLILPVDQETSQETVPYYFFIDDITADVGRLNASLRQIGWYSASGLAISMSIILIVLHLSLRRITRLAEALPLLSRHEYDQFRNKIDASNAVHVGMDELDNLSLTASHLAGQLETLEQNMRNQNFELLQKTQDFANERDFIKQLLELAPILVLTQKTNGIILSINHAGVDAFESDSRSLVGKVFDMYLPESDQMHIKKLNRLRAGEDGEQVQVDGLLLTESGKLRDISWLHKLLPSKDYNEGMVVLTLGLDISERKIAEARNIRMAYYDYLTGLGNRRKFQEEFSQKLASAERYGYQLALFYLDLDRFKEINDTSGHDAGDYFLKTVATSLKEAIRATDLLCRLGGDEFTMLMPHADLSGVDHIAKKINNVLKNLSVTFADKTYAASASIGIAVYPLHGVSVNELMANADLAMYRAKELGRGQHHMFDPDYDYRNKLNQSVQWRTLLEDAIEHDKLVLVYQPILNIRENDVSHYECLVRLRQDDGRLLSSSDFVFRAEELGLIGKIDRIVLQKAVEQHIEFKRQGKNYQLTINISKRSFDDPAFFEFCAEVFKQPGVDAERIIFEITDTASISNYQSTHELISRIKSLGCVLALNDFGVEYPSLNYLKSAPVDYVKIDGSLIRQIDKNQEDRQFVKSLIELAQGFGKKTVAEFVESEEVLAILRDLGIDFAQGFHIGKPKELD